MSMHLKISSSIVETLLAHPASAPCRACYIDQRLGGPMGVRSAADDIGAIIHTLTELVGDPQLITTPCARVGEVVAHVAGPVVDVTARCGVSARGSGAGGVR